MPKTKKSGVVCLRIRVVKDKEKFPSRDVYIAHVVMAISSQHARRIVPLADEYIVGVGNPWLDPKFTSCKQINLKHGKAGVILSDFNIG